MDETCIYTGTTPEFIIELPEEISVASITVAYISFEQWGAKLVEKSIEDIGIDTVNNTVSVTLTQADTLKFAKGELKYQLRFAIGGAAYATEDFSVPVYTTIKRGEI